MFNIDLFESNLKTEIIGKKNYYYASTSSTNNDIWNIFKKNKKTGIIVIANEQNEGRGRANNKWYSKKNKSIICSFLIKQKFSNEQLGLHAILVPLGIIDGIKKTVDKNLNLKWPNDIMYSNKKIGGVLIESKNIDNTIYLNIGFGLNVNEEKNDFPSEIKNIASSLKIITDYNVQREILLSNIINCIDRLLIINNNQLIIKNWLKHCMHINKNINVNYNNNILNAKFININNKGQAILNYNNKEFIYDGQILNT